MAFIVEAGIERDLRQLRVIQQWRLAHKIAGRTLLYGNQSPNGSFPSGRHQNMAWLPEGVKPCVCVARETVCEQVTKVLKFLQGNLV